MVNADTAPALPWGQLNEQDDVQQNQTNNLRSSESLATAPEPEPEPDHNDTSQRERAWPSGGSTIEVRWQLEEDDKTETVWWKATVARIQPVQAEQQAPAVLRYQAFRDFEEETVDVVLKADRQLYHSDSQGTLLRWRCEGDQNSDSEEEDEGDMVVDANDLNQHEELLERELGVSAEDVMRQQLENYPPDQQRQLASGARDFVDHFRQHLGQLAQASGGNHTVTANDINGIFASLRQR
ncbi:hypothetical protein ABBQ38_005392 [Trebouxia sp. C0009 RCD-2024]